MSRKEFFESIARLYNFKDLKSVQTAYWFSKNVHRPQKRDDGERYFEHPLRVAKSLIDLGYTQTETVITAFLHDVVEDTFTPEHVIIDLFGPSIWSNISLLSKTRPMLDPLTMEMISKVKKEKELYFQDVMAANKSVRLVKVADRVDNISDLETFTPERRERYIEETETYILPIAQETDPILTNQIKTILGKFKC